MYSWWNSAYMGLLPPTKQHGTAPRPQWWSPSVRLEQVRPELDFHWWRWQNHPMLGPTSPLHARGDLIWPHPGRAEVEVWPFPRREGRVVLLRLHGPCVGYWEAYHTTGGNHTASLGVHVWPWLEFYWSRKGLCSSMLLCAHRRTNASILQYTYSTLQYI